MGPQRFHGGRQSCLVYSRRSLRRYPDLTAQTDVNNPAVPSWLMQVALTQMLAFHFDRRNEVSDDEQIGILLVACWHTLSQNCDA